MRFFIYLVWILIALVLVTIALANTEVVRVTLTPEWLPIIGGFGLSLPLFVHIYAAIFAGLALGVFVEYVREGRYRRVARKAKRQLKKTEKQLEKNKADSGVPDDEVLAIINT